MDNTAEVLASLCNIVIILSIFYFDRNYVFVASYEVHSKAVLGWKSHGGLAI